MRATRRPDPHKREYVFACIAYLLFALCLSIPVWAYETPWVAASAGYIYPDPDRGAHSGSLFDLAGGTRLSNHFVAELNLTAANLDTGRGGYTDYYRTALGVRAIYLPWPDHFTPFASLGAGAVYNDTGTRHNAVNNFGEFAIGVMSPSTTRFGLRWRVELRRVRDAYGFDHDPEDTQILGGVVMPLRAAAAP